MGVGTTAVADQLLEGKVEDLAGAALDEPDRVTGNRVDAKRADEVTDGDHFDDVADGERRTSHRTICCGVRQDGDELRWRRQPRPRKCGGRRLDNRPVRLGPAAEAEWITHR